MIQLENEHYIRFILLLLKGGTEVLRKTVIKGLEKKSIKLYEFLQQNEGDIRKSKQITKPQWDILYPPSPHCSDISKWDISLLSYISLNFLSDELSAIEKKGVKKIREMRNDAHAHSNNAAIDTRKFTSIWSELSLIITTLSHTMTEDERQKLNNLISSLSSDQLDIYKAIEELKLIERRDEFFECIQTSLEQLHHAQTELAVAFGNCHQDVREMKDDVREMKETSLKDLTDIKKQLVELKMERESRGEYTKIVNLLGEIKVSAGDQRIVNTIEKIILSASTESVRQAEPSDTINVVKEKIDTFVEDVEGIGVRVESVREGSIVFTFSCFSLGALIKLIDYFQSPSMEGRLDDIARALESVTGHRVRLTGDIPVGPLQDILKQLHELYKRVLSVSQTRFVSDADPVALLDVFLQTEFIDYHQFRDISELGLTTQKNRGIIELVCRKGKVGYNHFKKCLTESHQSHLVDLLEQNEKMLKQKIETAPGLMRASYPRVMPQNQISEYPQQPVEYEIDKITYQQTPSNVNDGVTQVNERTTHLQMSLSTPSKTDDNTSQQTPSNVIDGVTPLIERTEDPRKTDQETYQPTPSNSGVTAVNEHEQTEDQRGKENDQSSSRKDPLIGREDQVDATWNKRPVQETGNVAPKQGVIIITLNMGNAEEEAKSINRNENINAHLSKTIKSEPSEESNDATSSSDRVDRKMLKETFRPQLDKPERKCTYDGRLMIYEEAVFKSIKRFCNTDKPISGGFGSVYLSEKKIPGLDIKVALKEITCTGDKRHFEDSAVNEKLASRTIHFAIVPLLFMGCDKDRKTLWFLSPCLDKGDLYTLIETDTQHIDGKLTTGSIELKRERRLKVVYHISAAIDFLHTEIEKFRGAVIHLDVKTKNVVLDRYYNARLTDFGVAREIRSGETSSRTSFSSIPLTDGYLDPPLGKLEKYYDYYNIGVVIRELLTGQPPCYSSGSKEKYLKDLDEDEVEFYILDKIWKNEETEELYIEAEKLLEISQRCINSATESGMNSAEKMNSKYILQEIQGLVKDNTWENSKTIGENSDRVSDNKENSKHIPANEEKSSKRLPVENENKERSPPVRQEKEIDENCDLCMVNPAVEKGLLSHASNCRSPLNVCVSCMRNSYLNPLHCHSCFKEIEPVIGGSGWGAVLVAGQYDDELTFSNSCAKDVVDIEKLVVSKCPLVIGIREMFVRTIIPSSSTSSQQRDDVTSQIESAVKDLKESSVRTLFLYFSGHCVKDQGFILKRRCVNSDLPSKDQQFISEYLSVGQLKDMLRLFGDRSGRTAVKEDKTVILIFDCCEPPKIEPGEDVCLKTVQLNACRPNQKAFQEPEGTGSLFKKMFIQGLTMEARGDKCFLQRDSEPCRFCPIKADDFITIGNLTTYISSHAKAYPAFQGKIPSMHVHNATPDVKIGYLVDTSADLKFTFIFLGMQNVCTIPCHFLNEINQLKRRVFTEFMDKMKVDKEKGKKLELHADDYQDILRIITKAGPKDKHKLELTSLEQILSAWNGKRELFAEMREISLIKDGLVGVFKEHGIFSFLDNWNYWMEEQEDRTVYKIGVSDFLELQIDYLDELNIGVLALGQDERAGKMFCKACPRSEWYF